MFPQARGPGEAKNEEGDVIYLLCQWSTINKDKGNHGYGNRNEQ